MSRVACLIDPGLTFRSRDFSKSNVIATALFGDGAALHEAETTVELALGELLRRLRHVEPAVRILERREEEVLQLRLRDLAVQAAGGAVDGPTGPLAAPQGLPPAEALRAAEAAVLEAGGDLARHLPASVAWLALADGVRTAGMGATGGPGPHP